MGLQTPGVPSSQLPAGEDHIMRRLADIERWIREALPSVARSIQPTVDRLDAADTAIEANLASINSLLTQVVKSQDIFFSAFNFALSTTSTVKASQTVTVPAGFTSAVVSVVSRVFAYNPNTTGGIGGIGGDYLGGVSVIAGASGNDLQSVVLGSGSSGVLVSPYTDVLSGLTPGGTFVLSVKAHSGFLAWSAQTGNTAEMSGTILWLK